MNRVWIFSTLFKRVLIQCFPLHFRPCCGKLVHTIAKGVCPSDGTTWTAPGGHGCPGRDRPHPPPDAGAGGAVRRWGQCQPDQPTDGAGVSAKQDQPRRGPAGGNIKIARTRGPGCLLVLIPRGCPRPRPRRRWAPWRNGCRSWDTPPRRRSGPRRPPWCPRRRWGTPPQTSRRRSPQDRRPPRQRQPPPRRTGRQRARRSPRPGSGRSPPGPPRTWPTPPGCRSSQRWACPPWTSQCPDPVPRPGPSDRRLFQK